MGVASTNHTDKFWHIGSAEEYSSEEFDGWGVRSYARVWRSCLQAVLNEYYFWFRQCGDVIIYVILHYLYSDIIVVWMWYSTGIWVIWSTTVLLHFDAVDFPSWKSGSFHQSLQDQRPVTYSDLRLFCIERWWHRWTVRTLRADTPPVEFLTLAPKLHHPWSNVPTTKCITLCTCVSVFSQTFSRVLAFH